MIYVTLKVEPKPYQISFEDMLKGISEEQLRANQERKNPFNTRTSVCKSTPKRLLDVVNIDEKIEKIKDFVEKYKDLIELEDKSVLYRSFSIPKKSGGLRHIDAPQEELMQALNDLKYLFEKHLFANYHNSAYAYVKGRCTIDAVKKHQANKSRWFLKLDFHDFFGSTTPEFIENQFRMLFPFNEIFARVDGAEALKKALSLCFLRGGLPQGTPISPLLTNLMMIPIDLRLSRLCRKHTPHLVYTRYADDMLISSDLSFKFMELQDEIISVLKEFNAPFELNTKKTRYGSNAGRNWNLGVMLNKDNEITIGHQKKKQFKAMLFSFATDLKNNIRWEIGDVQELLGKISYYRAVEKDNINKIIKDYSTKFDIDIEQVMKDIIANRI